MKVKVDEDSCIGCELCTQICPAVFKMDGDIAVVAASPDSPEEEDAVNESADSCPTDAIIIIDEN